MNCASDSSIPPRWLAWLANLTVLSVCPLLALGALVTTMRAGMADQRALVLPHRAIEEFALEDRSVGWKIEHSHRLAGWFAGICGIALAAGCLIGDRRHGYRWLGIVGLLLISGQGILGIFRVSLNAWWGSGLAWVHGSFAQIVFAFLVGVAYLMSQGATRHRLTAKQGSRRLALTAVGFVLVQLVLGGLVRHQASALFMRLHMLTAFVVTAVLLWLVFTLINEEDDRGGWATWLLLGFLGVQVLLGVESAIFWFARHIDPALAIRESVGVLTVRTAHYFVGSLLFATTVVVALKCRGQVTEAEALPIACGSPLNVSQSLATRLEGAL